MSGTTNPGLQQYQQEQNQFREQQKPKPPQAKPDQSQKAAPRPQQMSQDWVQTIRVPTTEAATAVPRFADGGFMNEYPEEDQAMQFAEGGGFMEMPEELHGPDMMAEQFDGSMEELPPGSLPHEVADDIDAKLSQGEFVMPADVVRWHGVKNLMAMREEAKIGLAEMAQEGMIKKPAGALEAPSDTPDASGFMDAPLPVDDAVAPAGAPFPDEEMPLQFADGGEAGGEANDQSGSAADNNGSGFGGADGGVGASGGAGTGGFGSASSNSGVSNGFGSVEVGPARNDATALGGFLDADDQAMLDAALDPGWGYTDTPAPAITDERTIADRPKDNTFAKEGFLDGLAEIGRGNIERGINVAGISALGSLVGISPGTEVDPETGNRVDAVNANPMGAVGGYVGNNLGSTLGGIGGFAMAGPMGGALGSMAGGLMGRSGGSSLGSSLGNSLGLSGSTTDAGRDIGVGSENTNDFAPAGNGLMARAALPAELAARYAASLPPAGYGQG